MAVYLINIQSHVKIVKTEKLVVMEPAINIGRGL